MCGLIERNRFPVVKPLPKQGHKSHDPHPRFGETGWWCAQSDANPSRCYLANIRVFFKKNSDPTARNVKKRCGTGTSWISRQFDIREEQGAHLPVNSERAVPELGLPEIGAANAKLGSGRLDDDGGRVGNPLRWRRLAATIREPASVFHGWRQLFNAIAAPSTDALKRNSWHRTRVTRSAWSAELRWNCGRKAPVFRHMSLLSVRQRSRSEVRPPQVGGLLSSADQLKSAGQP